MTIYFLGCFENNAGDAERIHTLSGLTGTCLWHRDVSRSPNMSFPKGLSLWKDFDVLSVSDAETM